jgi:hypothetical protein
MIDVREVHPAEPWRQVLDHVMIDNLEAALFLEMGYVASAPGQEVVQTDNPRALIYQPVTKMRSNEASSAGDKRYPFRSSSHS